MLELIAIDIAVVESCYQGSNCTYMSPVVLELVEDYYKKHVGIDITFHIQEETLERTISSALVVSSETDIKNIGRKFNTDDIEFTLVHTGHTGDINMFWALGTAWEKYGVTLVKPLESFHEIDTATVIQHEIAHLLKLDHTNRSGNLMQTHFEESGHNTCCLCGECTKEVI